MTCATAGVLALLLPQLQQALVGLRSTTTKRVALLAEPRDGLVLRSAELGGVMLISALAQPAADRPRR